LAKPANYPVAAELMRRWIEAAHSPKDVGVDLLADVLSPKQSVAARFVSGSRISFTTDDSRIPHFTDGDRQGSFVVLVSFVAFVTCGR
jgi:hypothetical protein